MTKKFDIRSRIWLVMLLLSTVLVMTVLPAAAFYTGDRNLSEYKKGTFTGEMNYTIGDSFYSPKMWSNESYVYNTSMPKNMPDDAIDIQARLYVYYTWSFNDTNPASGMYDTGVEPIMNVRFNGTDFTTPDANYTDWKNDTGYNRTSYNYPSGTYCYNVTGLVSTGAKDYPVNITNIFGSTNNQSFNIQAVGLLTWYNESVKYYWIEEGNDITYLKPLTYTSPIDWQTGLIASGVSAEIQPSDTKTWAFFSDMVNTDDASSATLITVAPSAGTINNTLDLNDNAANWTGLWDGSPRDVDFSWNTTTDNKLLNNLNSYSNNYIYFMNGIDDNNPANDTQMQAANAFLILTKPA